MDLKHTYIETPHALGTVLIIHGMAEHRKRYQHFASQLSQKGYAVLSVDLPGHGESIIHNQKGHLESVEAMTDALYTLLEPLPEPHIVFGHSMGSLVARAFFYHHPQTVDALILSGSPYKPAGIKLLKRGISLLGLGRKTKPAPFIDSMLNNTLAKSLPKGSSKIDWLSNNKENVQAYLNDPLCGFPLTYQGYDVLMDLFYEVYDKDQLPFTSDIPCLFVIGQEDPCPDFKRDGFNQAIYHLQKHISIPIRANIYEHSRHEVLNDDEKERVTEDILLFINEAFNA